ncbi:hypothetical protein [Bdellovibrio svalbardensis]|uniref:Uncharacterized protein n=1 Tax=Bdellovibrio svalbardensis TaxID=2972972 RepID=A0ABT6DE69_9BACT|nr:hypothetical protein [Bdellovibrio svalbardensis]MDG0814824.1 hypothetical protein [Bdellovibrio svalbardensis]
MTIEYVLLLFAVFFIGLKVFISAPGKAFKESGPRMAARVEAHLETGGGFTPKGQRNKWEE